MFRKVPLRAVVLGACCLWLLAGVAYAESGANWPAFRGADNRGVSENAGLPERWSASKNVEWKTEIPGRGWSSPVVWGNRVFLTTAVNLGEYETPKKGLYSGGDRPNKVLPTHQWKVFALDLETGRVLWERQVHEGVPQGPIHIKNSYASETPVTDGERLYIYFGSLGVFCFDLDGTPVWDKKLKPSKMRNGWGTASSPVLEGDRLYLVNDNDEQSYLLALDKATGAEIWRVPRDEGSNWSSPFIWKNDGRAEIVTTGTDWVRSYALDGKSLWSLHGMSSITVATPYEHEGFLYISSGYLWDPSRPVYAIRPGAEGDISLKEGQTSNEFIAWCQPQAAPYNPSTIVYDGLLYVLDDRGMIACFNAFDGGMVYERQRLPKGRNFTASPWACGGRLYFLNEDGLTFVVKAGETFEVLHTNALIEEEMYMATPAIAGDRLLIRSSTGVYSIRKGT